MTILEQKIKLILGLLMGNTAKNGPFFVDIDLTERCNLTCLGCPYHNVDKKLIREQKKIPRDMPLDVFKRICAELKDIKTRELIFQGTGEPFLYPHLVECVQTAKDLGFHITLLTNGTLLDKDIIRALSDTRLDTLKISLWATSEDQFRKNYPGTNPAIFLRIKEGLKKLADFKTKQNRVFPATQIHYVINNTNFHSINEMINLAILVGVNSVDFAPMANLREELNPQLLSTEQNTQLQKSLLQAKTKLASHAIEHSIDETLTRFRHGETVWKSLPCYITWYHARIRADGSVQPCGRCTADVDFGNVNTQSFKDIWNGRPIREFRTKTFTLQGLASLQGSCNCQYCCFVKNNTKIHKVIRRVPPLLTVRRVKRHGAY
jgi:MoaA/NifB/PqqE/SkfB family radical SAM enzyme